MFTIKIDASERYNKQVILLENDRVLSETSGDIDIVAEIETLLQKHTLTSDQIDKIDFNKGPGSFTGLKIAAAIANTFNWSKGKITTAQQELPEYGGEPNITSG